MRYSIAFSILTLSVVLATAQQKPNIIHILADDVGYDDIGCFGSTDISTPNIDSMASDGMLFIDFYAPHGTFTPSKAAILTGGYFLGIPYPNDHGPERLANTGSREFPPIPLIEDYDVIDELDNNEIAELPALFTRIACDYTREMAKISMQ